MQDYDFIETPENVKLQRRLAGVGARVMAGLIDSLILGLVYFLLIIILYLVIGFDPFDWLAPSETVAIWSLAVFIVISAVFYLGYFICWELLTNGRTIGKKRLKIRVVQTEGQGVTFSAVAIRNLLRLVDGIGLYTVGIIAMIVTRKVQRLGDLAAGTVVISEQVTEYSARYEQKKDLVIQERDPGQALADTGLSSAEYRLLANYYARRTEFDLETRKRLLQTILEPLRERLNLELPTNNGSVLLLEDRIKGLLDSD